MRVKKKVKPLTNYDISYKLRKISCFRGVFSADTLPERPMEHSCSHSRGHECGVINLADSDKPGTHWVAYYIPIASARHASSAPVHYYDPFGMPPDTRTINYLKQLGRPIVSNKYDQQMLSSIECGYFCCYWIRMMDGEHLAKLTNVPSSFNERTVVIN